ncbi:chemotaxis protein CheC [Fusibacter ferrireducens]|uniref:Chemotaxis protein CheC n=1 Tax=Fusibacter ferrireducens TaxID=2785058 RepID=A0ABR9ZMT4_9FIRM|nr:chemotaxis protein CheC [Fusibacter ferrireducens]MBF4691751.1 chemotaxis protein CheC [Fusibacter ferrireducens]
MSDQLNLNNSIVLDVLREIGNIGAGNAATSLAKMIDKKVDMKVPIVNVLEFDEVPEMLGGPENVVCGIFFKIEGDITGSIMFVLDQSSAINLVDLLMPRDNAEFDEFTISALKEIGNILSGAYVSSLSGLTNLKIKISIPALAIDMAGAILSVPAIEFGQMGDSVLIIQNEFIETNASKKVDGYFFLIPDMESYEVLLGSLGVTL